MGEDGVRDKGEDAFGKQANVVWTREKLMTGYRMCLLRRLIYSDARVCVWPQVWTT